MIVFDEVSTISFEDARERIDPVLYPNLAALARDGTWFRYATAPTDLTGTATPTILTGTVAERHQHAHRLVRRDLADFSEHGL